MKTLMTMIGLMLLAITAQAGLQYFDVNNLNLGTREAQICGQGQNCSVSANQVTVKPNDEIVKAGSTGLLLSKSDCGKTISSNGATYVTMPVATSSMVGCRFTFVTTSTADFHVVPGSGDTIYLSVSSTTHSIKATGYIGAVVSLQAFAANKWVAIPTSASFPLDAAYP